MKLHWEFHGDLLRRLAWPDPGIVFLHLCVRSSFCPQRCICRLFPLTGTICQEWVWKYAEPPPPAWKANLWTHTQRGLGLAQALSSRTTQRGLQEPVFKISLWCILFFQFVLLFFVSSCACGVIPLNQNWFLLSHTLCIAICWRSAGSSAPHSRLFKNHTAWH